MPTKQQEWEHLVSRQNVPLKRTPSETITTTKYEPYCKCVACGLRFRASFFTRNTSQSDSPMWFSFCPQCGNRQLVTLKKPIKPLFRFKSAVALILVLLSVCGFLRFKSDILLFTDVMLKKINPPSHHYALIMGDAKWTTAKKKCAASGGHLITINSEQELKETINQIEQYITWTGHQPGDKDTLFHVWMGGKNPGSENFENRFEWITGEEWSAEFPSWKWFYSENNQAFEPSFYDSAADVYEYYLCLWAAGYDTQGGWTFNDQRNNISKEIKAGTLGYICEWENMEDVRLSDVEWNVCYEW